MMRRGYLNVTAFILALGYSMIGYFNAFAEKTNPAGSTNFQGAAPAEQSVEVSLCFGCHGIIRDFHTSGKYEGTNCSFCYRGLQKHIEAQFPANRPVTDTSWETCGQCHKEQYNSFMNGPYHRLARMRNLCLRTGHQIPSGRIS